MMNILNEVSSAYFYAKYSNTENENISTSMAYVYLWSTNVAIKLVVRLIWLQKCAQYY